MTEANGHQDWADPEFVTGAILATIEDLTPMDKVRVLADALTMVIPELRE